MTEAISYLIDIIEIATGREALLAMTNEDYDAVSFAEVTTFYEVVKATTGVDQESASPRA